MTVRLTKTTSILKALKLDLNSLYTKMASGYQLMMINLSVPQRQIRMVNTHSIILILTRKITESTSYMVMKFGL